MRILKYFLNLVLIFTIIIFFIENSQQLSQRVQFHFDLFMPGFLWQMPELPLYFLLIVFFALGGLITSAIFAWGRIGLARRLGKSNKKVRTLEKEIKAYRQLPLITKELANKEESKPAPVPGPQGV